MAANSALLNIALRAKNLTGPAFKAVGRALTGLKTKTLAVTTAIRTSFTSAQGAVTGLLAVIGGFQALVKGPADFNDEMAKVGTLGAEARDRLAEFTNEVQMLSVESGIGPNELARGLFDVISAGTDASKAMDILRESTVLAVAGASDLQSVVSGLSITANAFAVEGRDAFREISQNLFAAQVIGSTRIEELSTAAGTLAATASEAGISITQLFTALADVTTVSASTAEAATSVRGAITALLKPNETLKKVLRNVGLELGANVVRGKNLGTVFAAIKDESDRLGLSLSEVFGRQQAVTAAVLLGADGGERYNEALRKQRGLLEELDTSYALMQGTLKSLLTQFFNLVQVLSQDVSRGLLVGLDEALISAIGNVDRLRKEAVVMGLEVRLAFENSIPAIKNTVDLILMLGEGFMFAVDAGKKVVDILLQQSTTQKRLQQSVKLANGIREAKRLKEEYNSLGDSIRRSIEFRKHLVDSNDIAAAIDDELAFRDRRSEISVQIRMAEAAQREARRALKELSEAPLDPSIERMASNAESIRERFEGVFLGGNLADPEAIEDLENMLKKAKRALAEGPKEVVEETAAAVEKLSTGFILVTERGKEELTAFEKGVGMVRKGLEKATEKARTTEEMFNQLGERFVSLATSSLARFFDSIVDGTAKGEEAFKAFGRSLVSEINRIMAEKAVQKFVQFLLSAGMSSGIDTSQTFTDQAGITTTNASPIPRFSEGGIVRRPTLAMVGEGGQNEAVVPLPNGRSIPVQFSNRGGGDTININISAVDGPSVERMLTSAAGRRAIEGAVRNAKATRRDFR